MQTRSNENPSLPPPPGAIKALVNGFNAITGNIIVILFPLALDLFLWLGPRLKADSLLTPFFDALPDIQAQVPADQAQLFAQYLNEFRTGLNLFSVFRTVPLGVFSLMSTSISEKSPLGLRFAFSMPDFLTSFSAILFLTLAGWIAGSLYFRAVSKAAIKPTSGPGIFRGIFQSILLSGSWMLFFILSYIPIIIIVWLTTLVNSTIRTIVMVILSLPAVWILLVVFYSFYGIFTNSQNAFSSIRSSMRLLRYGLPPLGWFTMLVILISQGMDLLWRSAPPESWMMGVGIVGHAFVSTSLLAASFIYSQELNIWIETALQWLKKQNNSSAQA